jgi:enoyl-CoA hydratase/carnithine racemase
MTTNELVAADAGRKRILTLNRLQRVNALSEDLRSELGASVLAAGSDRSVSILVMTAISSSRRPGSRSPCPRHGGG